MERNLRRHPTNEMSAFCVVLRTTCKLETPQMSDKRASANISLSSAHGTGETGTTDASFLLLTFNVNVAPEIDKVHHDDDDDDDCSL